MASPQYTTEKLIENIKRRCAVPTSQLTFTDEDWALLANDELQGSIVALIMGVRQEYFVTFVDVPAPANGEIDFPDNTVVSTIRDVCYVQNLNPLSFYKLPRINLDVISGAGLLNFNALSGYYVQGNKIILTPSNSVPVNTIIRLYYFKRTLVLTDPGNYGRIVALDVATNTIQLSNVPLAWTTETFLNGVNDNSPFNVVNEEMAITAISSPSIIVSNVTGLSVGDYISEQGFSAIPQVPIEAHSLLAQLTAAKALESLGDVKGMEIALKKAGQLKVDLLGMLAQRVQGAPEKLVNSGGGFRRLGNRTNRGF